jgi:hypothetical protein
VVSQYPIGETRVEGQYLDLVLKRGRTQCRAQEGKPKEGPRCCDTTTTCS